jgi:polyhydroxyalkanoate synthesis repressor PhaR
MRTIKRYANRKMYDMSEHRYLTLPQLGALVAGGESVYVIEQATERDITSQVLAQVLYEREKAGPVLPVAGLERVIREGLGA